MKNMYLYVAATLLFMALAASADDIVDPPWPREGDGKTTQVWEYENDSNPTIPSDSLINNTPYGAPTCQVYGAEWTNNVPGPEVGEVVSGWYSPHADNGFSFELPNRPEPLDEKQIQIQITSTKAPQPVDVWPTGSIVNTHNLQRAVSPWYTYVYHMRIMPNPDWESIYLMVPHETVVHEVVLDTWCLPEPAVGLMFVAGGIVLKRRE